MIAQDLQLLAEFRSYVAIRRVHTRKAVLERVQIGESERISVKFADTR